MEPIIIEADRAAAPGARRSAHRATEADDATPFASAEEAVFWFMAAYEARHAGARVVAGLGRTMRPCEPLDVLTVIQRLHRNRRLLPDHVRVLGHYGRKGEAPNPALPLERRAADLWREAMDRLSVPLRAKGIVA